MTTRTEIKNKEHLNLILNKMPTKFFNRLRKTNMEYVVINYNIYQDSYWITLSNKVVPDTLYFSVYTIQEFIKKDFKRERN